ncbi:hypothetical protein INT44_002220 [Umbelopsis vinacea]|uniref:Rab-GAP TBC domain-containing protein n=1 Tax=Umbelopsis vinacea TaxID=44442 RepID=A0A8H7Q2V2_9FUNG|nr:hypothetical protein INT44_002220 [Umbelopsis vinacea]
MQPADSTTCYYFKGHSYSTQTMEATWMKKLTAQYRHVSTVQRAQTKGITRPNHGSTMEESKAELLSDAMLETFDPITKLLNLMNALLDMADPQLGAFLDRCNVLPYYALSWILTWFSHDLEDYHKVTRLFDLFIASAPSMPLYVACAITCLRRKQIMAMDPDFVHTAVTNIPPDIDIEATIRQALVLEKKYPILSVQKHSGQWVHEHSAANTFDSDWAILQYDQEPNHVRVEQYLGKGIPKEEWEDEVLKEIMQRRRSSTTSKT